MTNGQFESPVVMNHGETYNEKAALRERYPYTICPECLSQNTEVVRRHRGPMHDYRTGDHATRRKGIWVYDVVRANYQCKDCKCEYYQWLATDRHFLFSEIDEDVRNVRNVMIYIAILLAFIVMWVFSWNVVNDDSSLWIVLMSILSPIVSGVMITNGLAEL